MASEGCSMVQALHDKYSCDEELQFNILVPKSAPGKKDSGELILPRHLTLNNCRVAFAGDEQQLTDLCTRVCELDLADNQLTSWSEVLSILSCLPGISFINLSNNKLSESEDVLRDADPLPHITSLILNNTGVTWSTVWSALRITPNLRQLHVSLNDLGVVETPQDALSFNKIKELYISKIGLDSFESLSALSCIFPALENLVLMQNPIERFTDEVEALAKTFVHVKSLSISQTSFNSWGDIAQLAHLTSLVDLRMQGLEFLEEYEEKIRRQLTIAYLPKLTHLNGSRITETERLDAERAFIRHHLNEEDPPKRFHELEAVHGKLGPLVEVSLDPIEVVEVLVTHKKNSSLRQINLNWTVPQLKEYMAEWYGVPPKKQRLFYYDTGAPYGGELLQYSLRKLHSYGVKDGDSFKLYG